MPVETLKLRTVFTVAYPSKEDISEAEKASITKSINDFEYALRSDDFDNRQKGYQKYVDVDSFVKFAMINEITKNIDGGEVSSFFHKDLGQKIKAGPIWDFDMSMGNTYVKDVNNPEGFLMLDRIWYERFFQDEFFAKRYKSLYQKYRNTIWNDDNINLLIDEALLKLTPAVERNNQKWFVDDDIDDFIKEVEALRSFLITRLHWMDENINLVKRIN